MRSKRLSSSVFLLFFFQHLALSSRTMCISTRTIPRPFLRTTKNHTTISYNFARMILEVEVKKKEECLISIKCNRKRKARNDMMWKNEKKRRRKEKNIPWYSLLCSHLRYRCRRRLQREYRSSKNGDGEGKRDIPF